MKLHRIQNSNLKLHRIQIEFKEIVVLCYNCLLGSGEQVTHIALHVSAMHTYFYSCIHQNKRDIGDNAELPGVFLPCSNGKNSFISTVGRYEGRWSINQRGMPCPLLSCWHPLIQQERLRAGGACVMLLSFRKGHFYLSPNCLGKKVDKLMSTYVAWKHLRLVFLRIRNKHLFCSALLFLIVSRFSFSPIVVCKEHDFSLLLELYNFSVLLYPI